MHEGAPTPNEDFDTKREMAAIESLIDGVAERNDEFAATTAIEARNIAGALRKYKTRGEMLDDLNFRLKSAKSDVDKDAIKFILSEHFNVDIK